MSDSKLPSLEVKVNVSADTKDLTPVAQNLINRISAAVGIWYAPLKVKRESKAVVDVVNALGAVDINNLNPLQQRAVTRLLGEETKNQENLEQVIEGATESLEEDAKVEKIDGDWLRVFFDKAKLVSSDEVRLFWSRILAGEANIPGTFSKRTLHVLSELSKEDAEIFLKLCRYVFIFGEGPIPVVMDVNDDIYDGIRFVDLKHLSSIGLIDFDSLSGFAINGLPNSFVLRHGNKSLSFSLKGHQKNEIKIGTCLFTEVGRQIYSALEVEPVEFHANYLAEKWNAGNYTVEVSQN